MKVKVASPKEDNVAERIGRLSSQTNLVTSCL